MHLYIPTWFRRLKHDLNSSSFKWYIKRMRQMNAGEIFFRLIDVLRKQQLQLSPKGRRYEFRYINFDWSIIQKLQLKGNGGTKIAINDSITVYGKEWTQLSQDGIKWESFLSGFNSNKTRAFQVKYRDSEILEDDIRFSWELNRLTWIYPLAFSKDESRILKALEYVRDFLKSDQPGYGLRWNSMIELAMQSISLQILSSKLAPYLTDTDRNFLEGSLSSRFRWLQKLPSRYSSNNNHRIAELTALILLAECAGSQRRSHNFQKQLVKELKRQTLKDGFNAELSPSYHLFVLELTIVLYKLLPNLKYSSELDSATQRMLSVAQSIEKINQVWPTFNDSDEAMLFSSLVPSKNRIEFLANFFGNSSTDDHSQLLTLSNAGYTFLKHTFKDSQISIAIDHGNIGFGKIAAHGHADSLALWLVIDKIPVLVESGTYSYHSNVTMRNYLRSGSAHNTITIDQESLSSPEGPFLWNPKNCAQSSLVTATYNSNMGVIQVSARYKKTNKHSSGTAFRTVSINENRLTIEDSATSGESLESHFIISSSFELTEKTKSNRFLFTNNDGLSFSISCDFRSTITTMPVHISPSYGVLEEGCRVTIHGKSANITQFMFNETELK